MVPTDIINNDKTLAQPDKKHRIVLTTTIAMISASDDCTIVV